MEKLLGGSTIDAVADHAVNQSRAHCVHTLARALVPHRAAQLVGFTSRETRRFDRQAHALLLKERNAERSFQYRFELGMRIGHRFQTRTPAQKRMDHLPLDRSGTNDGDLHDDVVKALWF